MTTALRFENNAGASKQQTKARQMQLDRIKYDDTMADRDNVMRLEKNISQRAEWNENLELASWKKRIKANHEIVKGEIRIAAKASLAVRRTALRQLIMKDTEMYEKEFNLMGKTFFKQRI